MHRKPCDVLSSLLETILLAAWSWRHRRYWVEWPFNWIWKLGLGEIEEIDTSRVDGSLEMQWNTFKKFVLLSKWLKCGFEDFKMVILQPGSFREDSQHPSCVPEWKVTEGRGLFGKMYFSGRCSILRVEKMKFLDRHFNPAFSAPFKA